MTPTKNTKTTKTTKTTKNAPKKSDHVDLFTCELEHMHEHISACRSGKAFEVVRLLTDILNSCDEDNIPVDALITAARAVCRLRGIEEKINELLDAIADETAFESVA